MEKSEDLFGEFCDNAGDLIQIVSPEGRLVYVNRSWRQALGYTEADLTDLTFQEILLPSSRPHCEEMMRRLAAGHPVQLCEADCRTKAGERLTVEGSATARFENGRLAATGWILRPVGTRRQVEEELGGLFNLSLDLLCIAGTDGFLKRVNPAFERVLGYSREELLSRSFIEFVHPDDRRRTLRAVDQLARGLSVVDFHNRYRARDGSWRWLAWVASSLPGPGLIYATARDITEARRSQQLMIQQSEELARSNADLEQFASVASHDLRAPLRAVANLAEWIEQELGPEPPAKTRRYLQEMRRRIQRMETLTDELLRYSQAGKVGSPVSRVNIGALIRDLSYLLAPPAGFTITGDPDLPELETLRTPLEQVFRNLLGNAIKHHDRPDGTVVVSARDRGPFVEFSVADDGPGIPPEHHEQIFKMFHKLGSRGGEEGNGIGLALVKRLVENQGGRVTLESSEGRGATFRFTWPRRIRMVAPPE